MSLPALPASRAEAGGEGAVAQRQLLALEDLVRVVVGDGHLGGGDEEALRLALRVLKASSSNLGSWPVPVIVSRLTR